MRLLALDIGNTNVSAGLFDDDRLVTHFRLRTDPSRPVDEYANHISSLITLRCPDLAAPSKLDGVAIASVVPAVTTILERVCADYFGLTPFVVTAAETDTGLRIAYDPPASLGADRLVNAFAAFNLYGKVDDRQAACIVVDYGTATKLEAVSADGVYRGGAILPGVSISLDALFARGALLRQIPLTPAPRKAIGGNTADALRSGILFGYAAQSDGLVELFRRELGDGPIRVVATGGLAPLIVPQNKTIDITDINLTITGLRMLYERNQITTPV